MSKITAVFLLVIIALAISPCCYATYLAICSSDSDCTISGERCLTLIAMGCSGAKGYCVCTSGMGYNFNKTACVTKMAVALQEVCLGADYEKHVANAGCYYGLSTCYFGYTRSGSSCVYNYGKACTNATVDCGYNTALACTAGTCQCQAGYKKSPSTGICVLKDASDVCSSDAECWPLAPSTGTGYTCASGGVCGCSSGYQAVQITDVEINEDDGSMKTTTATYCFSNSVGSTFNVAAGQSCNIWPYSLATSKISACASQTGCYVCPEDNNSNVGYGLCRGLTTIAPAAVHSTNGCKNNAPRTLHMPHFDVVFYSLLFQAAAFTPLLALLC